MLRRAPCSFFFFFNDTATTEIYTLSLHDALPIYADDGLLIADLDIAPHEKIKELPVLPNRSEEHTSELQSRLHLVCRLLLEKKKQTTRFTEPSIRDYEPTPMLRAHMIGRR